MPSLLERLLHGDGRGGPWALGTPTAAKALIITNPGPYTYGTFTYGTQLDYRVEAGDAASNAIVMACVGWIVSVFPEAPLQVNRRTASGMEAIPDHEMTRLIEMPNPYYSGQDLWDAMLTDYNITGNGFWLALLGPSGRAVELWYEPSFSIRPVGSEIEFISKWQVERNGRYIDLDPTEVRVMHFRDGIDPRNPRLGLSDLVAAYREMYTDNEASRYTAALLRNRGIPGVIISPKEMQANIDVEEMKANYMAKFSGDSRGEPLIASGALNVAKLDFSPAEMDLGALRTIPEERISALLGVPAIVAGLGAGLDSATYSNFQQAERKGWTGNIIPAHRRFAAALQVQLLPLLGDPRTERVSFDHSQVAALQEDQTAIYQRAEIGYGGGFLKLDEARAMTGWPLLGPEGDAFKTASPAPAFGALPEPAPAKMLTNGH